MEAQLQCPSCLCADILEKGQIPVPEIIDYYTDNGIDVRYLFKGIDTLYRKECRECGLQFFRPIVLGDDHYYHCLQQGDWYYLDDKPEYDYAARFIGPEDKVLDVGSGRGAFSKKLHCKFYQGLEFSESAVELAAKDGINVIPELSDEHAKRKPGFYDVVASFQVLEHVSDAMGFLKGSIDCLRTGGKLIIAVPNCDSFIEWRKNFMNIPPHHQLLWTEKSLLKLAQIHHLKVVDVNKERVSEVHRESFYSALLLSIKDKISPSNRDVKVNFAPVAQQSAPAHRDLSHRAADLLKVCFRAVKLHRFFAGHTITVVYEKQ